MTSHSNISTPLREKLPTDGDWGQTTTDATDRFDLQIHAEPARATEARSHLQDVGASVAASYGDMVFAGARAELIQQIANGAGIRKVEERPDPMAHSVSEGVGTTNADQLHGKTVTGSGVTVAVIDHRFNPDQAEITDSVIDQIGDPSSFQPGTSGLHGTACAEIVHEMAPDADLVLATTQGTDFITLMDNITSAHDPAVMSMSLGYKPTLRLDGQDYISDRIEEYTSGAGSNTPEGGLFAVSAGNDADGDHWDGPYRTDGSGYLEFDDTGNTYLEIQTSNSGQQIVVQSDADWSTDQGYLLEIYDSNQTLIKDPDPDTTPAQSVGVPDNATSYLRIKDDSLDGTEHFDVFTWGNFVDITNSTSERSIGIPATSPDQDTLSTGAVRHNTDNLEAFSSRGPTQDGRRGVDIVAPDGTQNDSWGSDFYGTSAACPHVAGTAALLSEFSAPANEDFREVLYAMARDIADSSVGSPPNRKIGTGYVDAAASLDDLVGLVQRWSVSIVRGPSSPVRPSTRTGCTSAASGRAFERTRESPAPSSGRPIGVGSYPTPPRCSNPVWASFTSAVAGGRFTPSIPLTAR